MTRLTPYASGRRDARANLHPPCGEWMRREGFTKPLDRSHFIMGFRHEKATDPLAPPFDPARFECRYREGCDFELPYPYWGA